MRDRIFQQPLGFFPRTCRPVFITSSAVMLLFILVGAFFDKQALKILTGIQHEIAHHLSWVLTGASTLFLLFLLFLLFSPYGKIRLGNETTEPEFGRTTWFAMLFSAGMGIGLVFWSIAEPVMHLGAPPFSLPDTKPSQVAMQITYFHWGLHAWAVFTVMALTLAYFCFRHNLPLAIRSAFYPLLGKRIFGPWGHAIDIISVVATMFGVATSLGLGALQVNTGLNYVAQIPVSTPNQIILITIITAMATTSVVLGLVKGISRLSHFNLWTSVAFLLFVLIAGPTQDLVLNLFSNTTHYLGNVLAMGWWTETRTDTDWRADWTTFYLAWWIAWAPFVGMFIARISRGRTIREFILGCLFGPTAATFVWLSTFGGTALHMEVAQNIGIAEAVSRDVSTALFFTLQHLPLQTLTAVIATLVIITFFVTSSDSGSLVIDIITSGGDPDPPKSQRVFWAITEGVIASILLLAGGLKALQTAAITTGLPFALVMIAMCFSLMKALKKERIR